MAFVVLYDACVLHPAPLRDLLVRIARTDLVQARWSEQILDECFNSIARQRPDLAPEALARGRDLLRTALRAADVRGHESLIESLQLPDPDDRHVLAAAIHCGAQAIVTYNLSDFPAAVLAPYNTEAKHPDDFVLESLDLAPARVVQVLVEQAADLRRPPMRVEEVLDRLLDLGLVRSVARLREQLSTSGIP